MSVSNNTRRSRRPRLHGDIAQRFLAHTRWIVELQDRVSAISEASDIIRYRIDALAGESPRCPSELRGPADANDGSGPATLESWVVWLVNAYDLVDRWPACWREHEVLVEIVRGLLRWHGSLTGTLSGDPTAATDWHDALFRAIDRNLLPVTQRCLTAHRPSPRFADNQATQRVADDGSAITG